ncbi:MAG: 3-hydroxyacyl-CoA dehydrogenase family protein, partial [Gammaproteobacteria bacterium]|nr:3-hydroxyacyl-CoA dehydrogenase family protein [Gammaproteobacteria bacterium]
MGPLTLADTVGLDICLSVAQILSRDLNVQVPASLQHMVDDGNLGAKSGSGFYDYKDGKKVKTKDEVWSGDTKQLVDRMIGRMVNESVACLREKVVENDNLLDAGVIFGTGFAPFRGGPLNFAKTEGYNEYKQRLNGLEHNLGDSFRPDEGWQQLTSG